ncbi:MAG: hypothetical protein M3153_03195 [Chloroflexota bacterium]|nr:hypothetical protein [Chloroflexota bacterium]
MDERQATDDATNDSDVGEPEQTWGQGEGKHQPTIEQAPAEEEPRTDSEWAATELDQPDAPPTRDEEGMDR